MTRLSSNLIRSMAILIVVFTQLTGCVSLQKVEETRRPPASNLIYFSHQDIFYDPDVRAYRLKTASGPEAYLKGAVLRDVFGKKIRTEQELARILTRMPQNEDLLGWGKKGNVAKTAYIVGFIIYLPVAGAVGEVELVIDKTLNIPFIPVASNLKTAYQERSEAAYDQGRHQFDSKNYNGALTEWDYAKFLMPSLQGNSDVDYWRGRALEARHESKLAITAYQEFLNFSDQAMPSYFNYRYPEDPDWSKKAEEAETREAALIKTISLSEQQSQDHLHNK